MCQFVGWQCVAGGAVGGGRHLDGPPHGEQTPGQSLVGLNQAFCSPWGGLAQTLPCSSRIPPGSNVPDVGLQDATQAPQHIGGGG